MEEITTIYSYLMGPVDALVTFGGALVNNTVALVNDTYHALLR